MTKGIEQIGQFVNIAGTVKIIRERQTSRKKQVIQDGRTVFQGEDDWETEYCVTYATDESEKKPIDLYKNDYIHVGTQGAEKDSAVAAITFVKNKNIEIGKLELHPGTLVYLGKTIDVINVKQSSAYTIPNLKVYDNTAREDTGNKLIVKETELLYVQLVTGKVAFSSWQSSYLMFAYTPHLLVWGRSFILEVSTKEMIAEDDKTPMNSKILALIEKQDEDSGLVIIQNSQKTLIERKIGMGGKLVVYAKLQPQKVIYPKVEIFADDTSLKHLKNMVRTVRKSVFKKDTGKRSTQVLIDF
jgi:hypothetical protein